MKLTEIEKCPWCGGEIHSVHMIWNDRWYITCRKCSYKTSGWESWKQARKEYELDKRVYELDKRAKIIKDKEAKNETK